MASLPRHSVTRPTISDVAKLANVAKSSVSHVLNTQAENCLLSAETRTRILNAVESLGYRPSWRAKSLTLGQTKSIGLVVGNLRPEIQGMNPPLMRACYESLLTFGYHMVVIPLDDKPEQTWKEPLLDQRVDGCLVMAHQWPRDILESTRLPTVLLNVKSDAAYPQVLADDAGGCTLAMQHLLDLGHRRICFLLDDKLTILSHYSLSERVNAYKKAMNRAGLNEHTLVDHGPVENFIARHQPGSRNGPTAILCYSHAEAMKLLSLLWQQGLRVPDQVSVVGFDDVFPAAYTVPPLTTVAVPAMAMGIQAVEFLMTLIENKRKPAKTLFANSVRRLPEQLIIRASTGLRIV